MHNFIFLAHPYAIHKTIIVSVIKYITNLTYICLQIQKTCAATNLNETRTGLETFKESLSNC